MLPNDSRDADGIQNYPVLTSAVTDAALGQTVISGSLNSTAKKTFRIEFFVGGEGDPSGHGEGEEFIGSLKVKTDSSGNKEFTATLNRAVAVDERISATATELFGKSLTPAGTSEFSANVSAKATSPGARGAARTERGTLSFADSDGDTVVAQTSGPGTLHVGGDESLTISLTGSDATSSLVIAVERGARGDGAVRLESLSVEGDLRSIIAPELDVAGEGIRLSGSLRTLVVRDIIDGADVIVGGTAEEKSLIGVRAVGDDSRIQTASTIEHFRARCVGHSEIAAPAMGSLNVRESFKGALILPDGVAPRSVAIGSDE